MQCDEIAFIQYFFMIVRIKKNQIEEERLLRDIIVLILHIFVY